MSALLYAKSVARKLLLLQLAVATAIGLLFCLKDFIWGASALCGGMAVLVPNVLFTIFAWRHQANTPAKGKVAWSFALGEIVKMIMTFTILLVALACFKAVLLPLIVTWVSVLVVQILAPAVINNKG